MFEIKYQTIDKRVLFSKECENLSQLKEAIIFLSGNKDLDIYLSVGRIIIEELKRETPISNFTEDIANKFNSEVLK